MTQNTNTMASQPGGAALVTVALIALGGLAWAYQAFASSSAKADVEAKKKRVLALQREEEENKRKQEEEMKTGGPKILCYFGSQTGTAEGFAKTIAEASKRAGFVGKVMDLESFDGDSFEKLVREEGKNIICCFTLATYGEGDPSDNAIGFASYVKEERPDKPLDGLRFTVFGLGNKQYEHYNQMGRMVNERLEALGGSRVYPYGEGDDDGTLQEDFNAWFEDLYSALRIVQFGMDAGSTATNGNDQMQAAVPEFIYESKWLANPPPNNEALIASGGRYVESQRGALKSTQKIDFMSRPYFKTEAFPVKVIRELRQSTADGGSTMHVELEIPSSARGYGTAFNLSIMPENDPAQVETVAQALGWEKDLDRWLSIRPKKEHAEEDVGPLIPTPCTLRVALATGCSLNNVPTKALIEKLACFAQDPAHKAEMLKLSSKEGKALLHETIVEPRVTIAELLNKFPSVRFEDPVHFMEIVPRLAARDYTIASSGKLHPRTVHLTMSLVREPLPGNREFNGVCTNALRRRFLALQQGVSCDPVYAFVKPSSFILPSNTQTPLIFVGPGTGIAPMRALIQERVWLREQGGARLGPALLFFGCRNKTEDFIYQDEFDSYKHSGAVSNYHIAFSRMTPGKKVYVQHLMQEQGDIIWDWISNKEAHVYVCGATQMGKDVHHTIVSMAESRGKMTDVQAKEYVARMSTDGRLVQELWS